MDGLFAIVQHNFNPDPFSNSVFLFWGRNSRILKALYWKGFNGTIITDGYYGYNHIEGITNAYCCAHARRKFYDAMPVDMKKSSGTLANTALEKMAKLFAIEKEIETLSFDEKVKIRQEKSKPLVDDFFSWCTNSQDKVLIESKTWKAIQYALNYKAQQYIA